MENKKAIKATGKIIRNGSKMEITIHFADGSSEVVLKAGSTARKYVNILQDGKITGIAKKARSGYYTIKGSFAPAADPINATRYSFTAKPLTIGYISGHGWAVGVDGKEIFKNGTKAVASCFGCVAVLPIEIDPVEEPIEDEIKEPAAAPVSNKKMGAMIIAKIAPEFGKPQAKVEEAPVEAPLKAAGISLERLAPLEDKIKGLTGKKVKYGAAVAYCHRIAKHNEITITSGDHQLEEIIVEMIKGFGSKVSPDDVALNLMRYFGLILSMRDESILEAAADLEVEEAAKEAAAAGGEDDGVEINMVGDVMVMAAGADIVDLINTCTRTAAVGLKAPEMAAEFVRQIEADAGIVGGHGDLFERILNVFASSCTAEHSNLTKWINGALLKIIDIAINSTAPDVPQTLEEAAAKFRADFEREMAARKGGSHE